MTTLPALEVELTPPEGCSPLDEEADEVAGVEDDAAGSEVEAGEGGDDVPGIVAALTAPKRPTAATAAQAAPTVSRSRSRRADSRASTLRSVLFASSMVGKLASSRCTERWKRLRGS